MNYPQLIHEYLDGELAPLQQDLLFAELSRNQELRAEFNKQVKLQLYAQSDMASITAPAECSNAIFAELGFSIPSSNYTNNKTHTSFLTGFRNFFGRKLVPASIALLALLLSGGGYYAYNYLYHNKIDNSSAKNNSNVNELNSRSKNHSNSLNNNNIPLISSFDITNDASSTALKTNATEKSNRQSSMSLKNKGNTAFHNNSNANSTRLSKQNANSNNSFDKNGSNALNEKDYAANNEEIVLNDRFYVVAPSGVNTQTPEHYLNNLSANNSNEFALNQYNLMSQGSISRDRRLILSLRNMASNSINRVSVESKNEWNKNYSLSLQYKLSRYQSIGIECGSEEFSQKFTSNINGKSEKYFQNPQLNWYGVNYMVEVPDLLWAYNLYPYALGFVGGTSIGPLMKAQCGVVLQPTALFRFTLGVEGAALCYPVQNDLHFSFKYGMSFGAGICL